MRKSRIRANETEQTEKDIEDYKPLLQDKPMSRQQGYLIYNMTGYKVNDYCELTNREAFFLCAKLVRGEKIDIPKGAVLDPNKIPSRPRVLVEKEYNEIWTEACRKGKTACDKTHTAPIMQEHAIENEDGLSSNDPDYYADGSTGTVYINFAPASIGFLKWLKVKGYAIGSSKNKRTTGLTSGVTMYIEEGGHSIEKKVAYARGFAKVLCSKFPKISYRIYSEPK